MSKSCEERLARAKSGPIQEIRVRRVTMKALVLAVLILGILGGAALAALNWSSRELISYQGQDGVIWVNEDLAQYAQPMGETYESEALKISMIDAIYDGRTAILTWQTESTWEGETVYLLCDPVVNGEKGWIDGPNASTIFLEPGEVRNSGGTIPIKYVDDHSGQEDTCEITLRFTVLRSIGEPVPATEEVGFESPAYFLSYYMAFNEILMHPEKADMIFTAPEGVISFDRVEKGMSDAEILIAAGRMELIDTLEVPLTLERNTQTVSLLPNDEPIEKDNGSYTLRVTRADLAPNSAVIELERVFKDEAAVEAFDPYYRDTVAGARCTWGFEFVNDLEEDWWFHYVTGQNTQRQPEQQPDGTWVWGYSVFLTELTRVPETVSIIPARDDPNSDARRVPHPDEGIVLTVPKAK